MYSGGRNEKIVFALRMYEKGNISFDYPIQRQADQWDHLQKSLLIHSIIEDYPIPALYTTVQEKIYQVLDGKQRLTTILDYINDQYPLHPDTPIAVIEDEKYNLTGKVFSAAGRGTSRFNFFF
jgi:hypothetical protein